jgi:hypothetical protein
MDVGIPSSLLLVSKSQMVSVTVTNVRIVCASVLSVEIWVVFLGKIRSRIKSHIG